MLGAASEAVVIQQLTDASRDDPNETKGGGHITRKFKGVTCKVKCWYHIGMLVGEVPPYALISRPSKLNTMKRSMFGFG